IRMFIDVHRLSTRHHAKIHPLRPVISFSVLGFWLIPASNAALALPVPVLVPVAAPLNLVVVLIHLIHSYAASVL
ncbi:hypothetical protein EDB89DRAFT_1997646, partial [Lactarius sanguifluus]